MYLTSMVEPGPVSSLLETLARLEMGMSHSHNLAAEQLRSHTPQGLWALRKAPILTR
jgi:hypothetical protein